MTTELATTSNALARLTERADLIRRTVAPDATAEELTLFLEQCARLGLDPIIRQAYLIKRKGRATLQVGIDGLRSIADRTDNYAGNDEPTYAYDKAGKLFSASVTVWKWSHGQRCPFSALARLTEYSAGTEVWSGKPHIMLAKCAEALALRKAFPSQMEGAYTQEEMDQVDYGPPHSAIERPASPHQPDPDDLAEQYAASQPPPMRSSRTTLESRYIALVNEAGQIGYPVKELDFYGLSDAQLIADGRTLREQLDAARRVTRTDASHDTPDTEPETP